MTDNAEPNTNAFNFNEGYYDDMEDDDNSNKFLSFSLGDEVYGLHISSVIEIIGLQKITHIPDVPNYVKGVINLRGKIIPVIDIRLRFNFSSKEYNERTCIIVVSVDGLLFGVVVDGVNEVVDIPETQIDAPNNLVGKVENQYIKGLGKVDDNVNILLDVEKLLKDDEKDQMAQIGQQKSAS